MILAHWTWHEVSPVALFATLAFLAGVAVGFALAARSKIQK